MNHRSARIAMLSTATIALLTATTLPARAQNGTWFAPAVTTTPGPRREFGAIFDRANQRYMLFNDIWQLSVASDPPVWSQIAIAGSVPGPRHSPQWGYDAARNRVLIFGGYGQHHPGDPYAYLDDVWELDLDGTPQWTEIFPSGQTPSGRLA